MSKTSISFRVPTALWRNFKQQTDALFLSRAPFLDHVLHVELNHLSSDLDGTKLSSRTKRYIANKFPRENVSVNIDVSPQTAKQLRDVLGQHNLVRDAFMARLIIFLRGGKYILNDLEIPHEITATGPWAQLDLPSMSTSPMRAMGDVLEDPLYYVREYVRYRWGMGLYVVDLHPNLDWAACTLAPDRVEGSGAFNKAKNQREQSPALMRLLDNAPKLKNGA